MDTLTKRQRSERMALIRCKDTGPEMTLRRLVHSMRYRYRLHDSSLPGKPDLVFRSRGKLIFMHGCFWHRHRRCVLARLPKSKLDFWKPKLEQNRQRDTRNRRRLRRAGWSVLVVWECELHDKQAAARRIRSFLEA